jgi:hypothetical protein
MTTHADFEDFLRLLEERSVEYMIVGGFAVAYHGFPRFTKDIDVFYANTPDSAVRLQAALVEFGFQPVTVSIETLQRPDSVLSIGLEPVRIDLLNQIAGVSFAEALPNAVRGRYGEVNVWFIGKADLLRNKRATGLQRDLGDVEELS